MIDLRHGDCLDLMKDIYSGSIDLVVTSPPYDNLRTYNDSLEWNESIWQAVIVQLKRIIKKGGVVVWIVNDATINGSETGTSFKQALYFKKIGFNLHDTMIWQKSTAPFQHKNRYVSCFEYMFVFSKEKPNTSNLIRDRKNKHGGIQVRGTERQPNGKTKKRTEIQKSKVVKEFGSRFNIWSINEVKSNTTNHPAVFPIELAQDHIKTWSNENDIVLDPFMGSGTTGVACKNLNRNFIGIEKDDKYFEIAKNRINET